MVSMEKCFDDQRNDTSMPTALIQLFFPVNREKKKKRSTTKNIDISYRTQPNRRRVALKSCSLTMFTS